VLGMRKRVMWCVRERPKLYPLKKKKKKTIQQINSRRSMEDCVMVGTHQLNLMRPFITAKHVNSVHQSTYHLC
jgi:hypothetical protein